jgi:hypothetical protein
MSSDLPGTYALNIYQGDLIVKVFRLRDATIDPVTGDVIPGDYKDLTGKTVQSEIRTTKNNPTVAAAFTGAVDADQVTNKGQLSITMLPAVSKTLSEGNYVWDLQVKTSTTDIKTYLAGPLVVVGDVTDDA